MDFTKTNNFGLSKRHSRRDEQTSYRLGKAIPNHVHDKGKLSFYILYPCLTCKLSLCLYSNFNWQTISKLENISGLNKNFPLMLEQLACDILSTLRTLLLAHTAVIIIVMSSWSQVIALEEEPVEIFSDEQWDWDPVWFRPVDAATVSKKAPLMLAEQGFLFVVLVPVLDLSIYNSYPEIQLFEKL
ncbi:hypothetical protein STEG23_035620 [Scotinomys teguina]